MSDFFESVRSPGVVGVLLGLVVLLSFGGLSMAVFDDRLNGNAASALKNDVEEQELQILSLKNDIERAEEDIVTEKKNKVIAQKMHSTSLSYDEFVEKESDLMESIASKKKAIVQGEEKLLAYRERYRAYERNRAIGEQFEEVVLTTGKVLDKAKIREIFPDKIRFSTSKGGTSVSWKELPETWRDRFQIGEGELEQHKEKMSMLRKQRMQEAQVLQQKRGTEMRELELKKRVSRIANTITSKRRMIERDRASANILRSKAQQLRLRASSSQARGSVSSHSSNALKADSDAEKLKARIRISETKIVELEKERKTLETELSKLN